jgi:hypothetical protein
MARLGLKQLPRWAKPLTLRAMNFAQSAGFKWCASSSPDELLRRARKGEVDPLHLRSAALNGLPLARISPQLSGS